MADWSTEHLADHRLEVLERERVVGGVERGLVPLVGEARGELVRGMVLVLQPHHRVEPHAGVVVQPLEVLVDLHHPGRIGDTHGRIISAAIAGWLALLIVLPMSWHQRGDDHVDVGTGALGAGGRLQAVLELVDLEALHQPAHRAQQAEDPVGHLGQVVVEMRPRRTSCSRR